MYSDKPPIIMQKSVEESEVFPTIAPLNRPKISILEINNEEDPDEL